MILACSYSVKFHLSASVGPPSVPHITHVVLRIDDSMQMSLIKEVAIAAMSMDQALSGLSHLRQVIVQCRHQISDVVKEKLIRVRDKVLVVTIGEYDKVAKELKNGKISHTCPIRSPLWVEKPDKTDGESSYTYNDDLPGLTRASGCLFSQTRRVAGQEIMTTNS